MGKWVIYIIQSTVNGKLYTGMSNDVIKRVAAHNAGRGAKYTRTGRPWRLAYVEIVPSKSDALRRERQIKKMRRSDKIRLISTLGKGPVTPLRDEAQGS